MAFYARALARPIHATSHRDGGRLKIGGVTFGPRMDRYAGTPTAEMLASDRLLVRDAISRPYPDSCEDRFGKNPPTDARAPEGGYLAGPGAMAAMRDRGDWPGAHCEQVSDYLDKKIANPEAVTRAHVLADGYTGAEVDAEVARRLASRSSGGIPDVSSIPAPTLSPDDGEESSLRTGTRKGSK